MELPKRRLNLTRTLKKPNIYTTSLDGEFSRFAFNEERAPLNKGKWRSEIFAADEAKPMDVEIGTGNGFHFGHRATTVTDRLLVGLEIKYKPLVQSIRRAVKAGSTNAAICRYHAFNIADLFEKDEVNDIFIHFPDPWTSPKKPKNRVMNRAILELLHGLQRPGSKIEFKTDSREMFLWALKEIEQSPYEIEFQTLDLHKSEKAATNFVTFFEKIFLEEGIQINYALLKRKD